MLSALIDCIRFYSRLPVPVFAFEKDPHGLPDFPRIVKMLPLASLIITLPAACVLVLANLFWPPIITATLTVTMMVLATGAFHEDGLADVADGLGGGQTVERRLEIMTDSRIGTYGGAALVLSLLLRASVLADLTDGLDAPATALIVLAVAPLSRMAGLLPLMLLANAKPDGKAAAVGRPGATTYLATLAFALLVSGTLLWWSGCDEITLLLVMPVGFCAVVPLLLMARRLIGGQTGDVAGAAQQIAEIASLLTLSACAN
jgi:adenosylcobinamide-GDP ribazoletransferase